MEKVVKKYLDEGYTLESNVQCKKELKIVSDNLKESTLTIICRKDVFHPKLKQYELHDGFILRFENAFSMFIHPEYDVFHYILKDLIPYDGTYELTEVNFERIFREIDTPDTLEFV